MSRPSLRELGHFATNDRAAGGPSTATASLLLLSSQSASPPSYVQHSNAQNLSGPFTVFSNAGSASAENVSDLYSSIKRRSALSTIGNVYVATPHRGRRQGVVGDGGETRSESAAASAASSAPYRASASVVALGTSTAPPLPTRPSAAHPIAHSSTMVPAIDRGGRSSQVTSRGGRSKGSGSATGQPVQSRSARSTRGADDAAQSEPRQQQQQVHGLGVRRPELTLPDPVLLFISPVLTLSLSLLASHHPFTPSFIDTLHRQSSNTINIYLLTPPLLLFNRVLFILSRDKLKQRSVARAVGLAPSTISPMLKGNYRHTKVSHLMKLRAWCVRRDMVLMTSLVQRATLIGSDEIQLCQQISLTLSIFTSYLLFAEDLDLAMRNTIDDRFALWEKLCGGVSDKLVNDAITVTLEAQYKRGVSVGKLNLTRSKALVRVNAHESDDDDNGGVDEPGAVPMKVEESKTFSLNENSPSINVDDDDDEEVKDSDSPRSPSSSSSVNSSCSDRDNDVDPRSRPAKSKSKKRSSSSRSILKPETSSNPFSDSPINAESQFMKSVRVKPEPPATPSPKSSRADTGSARSSAPTVMLGSAVRNVNSPRSPFGHPGFSPIRANPNSAFRTVRRSSFSCMPINQVLNDSNQLSLSSSASQRSSLSLTMRTPLSTLKASILGLPSSSLENDSAHTSMSSHSSSHSVLPTARWLDINDGGDDGTVAHTDPHIHAHVSASAIASASEKENLHPNTNTPSNIGNRVKMSPSARGLAPSLIHPLLLSASSAMRSPSRTDFQSPQSQKKRRMNN